MRGNEALQKDVLEAIKWEPLLKAAEIGVIAKDGIITLSGSVDSFAKKMEAEDAAKTVVGVKAVIEKIEIRLNNWDKKDDNIIAQEVLTIIHLNTGIPNDTIKVKVEKGWVTLEGILQWNYQREDIKKSVRKLFGVLGVTNDIIIQSDTTDEIEKRDIENALERNWSTDHQEIDVNVSGNKVTLKGKVESLYQKEEAGRMAWNAMGVWEVENELFVEHKLN